MRWRVLAVAIILAAAAAAAAPAPAHVNPNPSHPRLERVQTKYLTAHHRVAKKLGAPAAGRNLVIDGWNGKRGVRRASRPEVQESLGQLHAMLSPAVAVTPVAEAGTSAIPEYIWVCESGGDYNAVGAEGAIGKYQILPSTAATYGCDLSTHAGQDACAGEIYGDVGSSAWSCG